MPGFRLCPGRPGWESRRYAGGSVVSSVRVWVLARKNGAVSALTGWAHRGRLRVDLKPMRSLLCVRFSWTELCRWEVSGVAQCVFAADTSVGDRCCGVGDACAGIGGNRGGAADSRAAAPGPFAPFLTIRVRSRVCSAVQKLQSRRRSTDIVAGECDRVHGPRARCFVGWCLGLCSRRCREVYGCRL